MRLAKDQIEILSRYFSDFSKILVASVVVGFFIPSSAGPIPPLTFTVGVIVAAASLILSVRLAK